MGNICERRNRSGPKVRTVVPNHLLPDKVGHKDKAHPNRTFKSNMVKTTKYTIYTFLPKNLFEQFHRYANLYFIFVAGLNWIPQINAFGKEISAVPVIIVLVITAVKDAFEDFRRYRSDRKINHLPCRVYSKSSDHYKKCEWQHIYVGDFVHLSCNEVIPADILLLKSSDPQGVCHVETSNLDGETNLKQRQSVSGLSYGDNFQPKRFDYKVECELPNAEIYKFHGSITKPDGEKIPLNKDNLLLRGCIIRNTDYIEGLVVYAGPESKAMLNNKNPRYKRTKLEQWINRDVVYCVILLLFLCSFCAIGSMVWIGQFEDVQMIPFIPFESSELYNPYFQGFVVFFTYIILYQHVIPIAMYVAVELVKMGQLYFILSDQELYHEPTDKKVECRALNINENLGQIEYVFSDKTGTLTENIMEFKSCTIGGVDYPHLPEYDECSEASSKYSVASSSRTSMIMENLRLEPSLQRELSNMSLQSVSSVDVSLPPHMKCVQDFFLLMAVCNTVVVSAHPHEDLMDDSGSIIQDPGLPTVAMGDSIQDRFYPKLPDVIVRKGSFDPLASVSSDVSTKSRRLLLPALKPSTSDLLRESSRTDCPSPVMSHRGSIIGSSRSSLLSSVGLSERTWYEAESPDELALVRASATYGCSLLKRSMSTVTVWLPAEGEVEFDVLASLDFDNIRKRMSVIVQHPITKEITLYTKGADTAVISVLHRKFREEKEYKRVLRTTEKHILQYAMKGLRTLCMGKRCLSKDEFRRWMKLHSEAESALEDREEKILSSCCKLEKNLELLGATGIEDKLQEGVPETIARLRRAGIKVWVLTGDKQETAIQVAYASNLFSKQGSSVDISEDVQDVKEEVIMLNATDKETTQALLEHHLEELQSEEVTTTAPGGRSSSSSKSPAYSLVIDGKTLAYALDKSLEEKFLKLTQKCDSVVCCRATPIQKGRVVKLVRDKLNKVTLAIGDGANDVSMIHAADMGIGISGQEGMQAVMASDFAIARFKHLGRLVLVHGHWCYDRMARFSSLMFQKSLVTVFALFWFQMFSGFSGGYQFDNLFMMEQHLVFLCLPPILIGIFDKDVSAETLMANPHLYSVGRECKMYTPWTFLAQMLDAVWQSGAMFFVCYLGYGVIDVGIWEFGTTNSIAVIVVVLLTFAIETRTWVWPTWLSYVFSFVSFWMFTIFTNSFYITFDHPVCPYWLLHNTVARPRHIVILFLASVVALLPRFTIRVLQQTLFPDVSMMAHQEEKRQEMMAAKSRNSTPDSGNATLKQSRTETGGGDNGQSQNIQTDIKFKNGRYPKRQGFKSNVRETTT